MGEEAGTMMQRRYNRRQAAVMVEAAILTGVIMTMLMGAFYAWRLSVVAMEAKVALRSEMMMHSMAVNSNSDLNSSTWAYASAGFSDSPDFYYGVGMFEQASGDDSFLGGGAEQGSRVTLTYDRPSSADETSIPDVYDVMRQVLVGAVMVNVTVDLPPTPFVNASDGSQSSGSRTVSKNFSQTAMCSVNPWALREGQALEATKRWIEGMEQAGAPLNDAQTLMRQVEPIEDLPETGSH
jgi:hypothetical protein